MADGYGSWFMVLGSEAVSDSRQPLAIAVSHQPSAIDSARGVRACLHARGARARASKTAGIRSEQATRRGRRPRHPVRSTERDALARRNRRRKLKRLEAHERRLVVERRLQESDLRLQQITLRLRHEEARGQAHFVAPLLGLEALL